MARPATRPSRGATEYQFTRNDVHYTCVARPSADRTDEHTWIATVESSSFDCFLYTGSEFDSKNDRAAFESEVIDAVMVRTHQLNIPVEPQLQLLRMSELRPGRLLERRDGVTARVAEVDTTRKRVLLEIAAANGPRLVWAELSDVQLSRDNPLFVCPRGFQVAAS